MSTFKLSKQEKQLKNLNKTIKRAKNSKLYGEKLKNINILKSIKDISTLPFTTKNDLRDSYPFGGTSVDFKKIIEIHTSSGTTGKPTLSFYTKKDFQIGSEVIAKAWKKFGINKDSRVQFIMSYGLFSGAMLNTYAIQELGAFVLPASILPTVKQLELMRDFKIDTVVSAPGYLLYLYEYMREHNINRKNLNLKRAIAAGEIYSDLLRSEIEQKLDIKVYDHYGLCEVNTGIAYECEKRDGLHILDDYVIPEIVDINTGTIMPNGKYGELVLTSLKKEASPIIRYRTGDITCIKKGKCKCGNKEVRIDRIKARTDDLLFIKGIKINPHELKDFILEDMSDKLYASDMKILVKKNTTNYRPCIKLSFKKEWLYYKQNIEKKIKNAIGVNFDIIHVEPDFFDREKNNKVKFIEFI